jgi:hypothetical protein
MNILIKILITIFFAIPIFGIFTVDHPKCQKLARSLFFGFCLPCILIALIWAIWSS